MTHRFFRIFGTAAIAATLVFAAACSKNGEVEAHSAADGQGNVDAGASASVTGTAAAPPPVAPPPASTGTATGGTATLKVTVNDGTGFVPVQQGGTLRLPYGTNIMFDPPIQMSAVSVAVGPFKTWQAADGSVVAKFDPSKQQIEELEKGQFLDATLRFSGGNLSFRVGKR